MHFSDTRLTAVWDKVQTGQRLTRDDGLLLFETDDLLGLGRMADHVKSSREGDRVYFVLNRYISPTNVCVHKSTIRLPQRYGRDLRRVGSAPW